MGVSEPEQSCGTLQATNHPEASRASGGHCAKLHVGGRFWDPLGSAEEGEGLREEAGWPPAPGGCPDFGVSQPAWSGLAVGTGPLSGQAEPCRESRFSAPQG